MNGDVREGLFRGNPVLAHLLGLCPLLAVTTTALNGLLLGVATLLTLTLSCVVVSLLRHAIAYETRLLAFVTIVACIVGAVDLLLETFFFVPHLTLGLFVPLIVTNCAILSSMETFAVRNGVGAAALGALSRGAGLVFVLFVVGVVREVVATGAPASLFGGSGEVTVYLAVLPPGAFFALAALLALSRWLDGRRKRAESEAGRVQLVRRAPTPHTR